MVNQVGNTPDAQSEITNLKEQLRSEKISEDFSFKNKKPVSSRQKYKDKTKSQSKEENPVTKIKRKNNPNQYSDDGDKMLKAMGNYEEKKWKKKSQTETEMTFKL